MLSKIFKKKGPGLNFITPFKKMLLVYSILSTQVSILNGILYFLHHLFWIYYKNPITSWNLIYPGWNGMPNSSDKLEERYALYLVLKM